MAVGEQNGTLHTKESYTKKGEAMKDEYRVERNGPSIKVYKNKVYLGSISLKELGEYLEDKKTDSPSP